MVKAMKFEMKVMNVFRLSNGRTVLAGLIDGHPELIRSCTCELQLDGGVHQRFECEGEQIVKKHSENDLRAVATVADVSLTSEDAKSGNWMLVCVG